MPWRPMQKWGKSLQGGAKAVAGRRRKYKVALTNTERNRLKEVVRDKRTSNTIRNRCRILFEYSGRQTSLVGVFQKSLISLHNSVWIDAKKYPHKRLYCVIVVSILYTIQAAIDAPSFQKPRCSSRSRISGHSSPVKISTGLWPFLPGTLDRRYFLVFMWSWTRL